MKKTMVLIIMVILLGVLLAAASPLPPPHEEIKGVLRWEEANVCKLTDFVASEDGMANIYLTGVFHPTKGELTSCRIVATGFNYVVGRCHYFAVNSYKLVCPDQ